MHGLGGGAYCYVIYHETNNKKSAAHKNVLRHRLKCFPTSVMFNEKKKMFLEFME